MPPPSPPPNIHRHHRRLLRGPKAQVEGTIRSEHALVHPTGIRPLGSTHAGHRQIDEQLIGNLLARERFRAVPWLVLTAVGNETGWAWGTMLLPYLDQGPLYQRLAPNGGNAPTIPDANTRTVLPVLICPSDASANWNQQKGGHAKSNYVAMFGSNKDFSEIGNGMFFYNSSTRDRDITDGMSNTIAMGERSWDGMIHPVIGNGTVGRIGSIWFGNLRGNRHDVISWCDPLLVTDQRINGTHPNAFSSLHFGGGNFLFADGSVHFLNENIDNVRSFCALATSHENEAIGEY